MFDAMKLKFAIVRLSHLTCCIYYLLQSCDHTAAVWDTRTGRCEIRFDKHDDEVNAVRFFPSGDALATACNDGTVSQCVCVKVHK